MPVGEWISSEGERLGPLVASQPGVHPFEPQSYTFNMPAEGPFPLDIRFAHRKSEDSAFRFRVIGGDAKIFADLAKDVKRPTSAQSIGKPQATFIFSFSQEGGLVRWAPRSRFLHAHVRCAVAAPSPKAPALPVLQVHLLNGHITGTEL